MSRDTPIWTNFTAGELSPHLEGRVDLSKYYNGVYRLENFTIKPHGPAVRRPGTRYIAETKDSSKVSRLIPFIFSVGQAYVLEFGNGYVRFFYDQGQLSVADTDAAVTNGTFDSGITGWTDRSTGAASIAYNAGLQAMNLVGAVGETSHAEQAVNHTSAEVVHVVAFEVVAGPVKLRIGTTSTGAEIINDEVYQTGYHIREFTPPAANTTFYLQFLHTDNATRTVDNISLLDNQVLELTSPYTDSEIDAVKYAQSADIMYLAHQSYLPRKLSRLGHSSWSLAEVQFTAQPAEWTGSNYPGAVGFFEQRCWYGGTPNEPQTLWGSVSGDYEDMTIGTAADDALVYTMAADQINAIQWILAHQRLVIGTSGAVWTAGARSSLEAITPTNVRFERDIGSGVSSVQGRLIEGAVLAIDRHSKKLRKFAYSEESGGYMSIDLTLLAEHITESGIKEFDFAAEPDNTLWLIRNDGVMMSDVYYPAEDVIGWARQITAGEFESEAVIPGDGRDEVWLIVNRTINGSTKRYVELLEAQWDGDQEDCFFVDCGLTLDSPVTITGVTSADPVVVTAPSHGFSNGDRVRITGVVGADPASGETDLGEALNRKYFLVADKATHTFELTDLSGNDIDGSDYSAYVSGGEVRKCVSSVSGLDHLEGETVQILGDGAVLPPATVSSGTVLLGTASKPQYASIVHVGLGYESILETMRINAGASRTAQGHLKRIVSVIVRFYQTVGGKMGTSEETVDVYPARQDADLMDHYVPALTGDSNPFCPEGGWERDGRLVIKQDLPLPMTIIAIMPLVQTSDR